MLLHRRKKALPSVYPIVRLPAVFTQCLGFSFFYYESDYFPLFRSYTKRTVVFTSFLTQEANI